MDVFGYFLIPRNPLKKRKNVVNDEYYLPKQYMKDTSEYIATYKKYMYSWSTCLTRLGVHLTLTRMKAFLDGSRLILNFQSISHLDPR